MSGKAADARGDERQGNARSREQYPAVRRCPIGSPSKIDGFLITEKNRQNDPLAATPRVVDSEHYTWTTRFFFVVTARRPSRLFASSSSPRVSHAADRIEIPSEVKRARSAGANDDEIDPRYNSHRRYRARKRYRSFYSITLDDRESFVQRDYDSSVGELIDDLTRERSSGTIHEGLVDLFPRARARTGKPR